MGTKIDEHIKRLFAPFEPGFAYVRTDEFMKDEFEPLHPSPISPEMLERARAEAVKCIEDVENEIKAQFENDGERYLEDRSHPAWDARTAQELRKKIKSFCKQTVSTWNDSLYKNYKQINTQNLDDDGLEYVKSFVNHALEEIPDHFQDGDEPLYYDSASTKADDESLNDYETTDRDEDDEDSASASE